MFKESIFNSNVFKENSIYKKGVLTEEASEKDKFSYEITALKLIKAAIFFFQKKKKEDKRRNNTEMSLSGSSNI